MSGLVHRPEEIPPDAVELECRDCGERYPTDRDDDRFPGIAEGTLQCLECSAGGLIPCREPRVELPRALGRWSKGPHAIWERGDELGLGTNEKALLSVLWQHAPRIYPSRARLRKLTGLSEWRLRKAMEKLIEVGLVEREQGRWENGRQAPNLYAINWQPLIDGQPRETQTSRGEQPPRETRASHGDAKRHDDTPPRETQPSHGPREETAAHRVRPRPHANKSNRELELSENKSPSGTDAAQDAAVGAGGQTTEQFDYEAELGKLGETAVRRSQEVRG